MEKEELAAMEWRESSELEKGGAILARRQVEEVRPRETPTKLWCMHKVCLYSSVQ